VVFGTRPEAIKMAPVVKALKARPELEVKVCVTAQHRQMLDQVMDIFGLTADFDLNVMAPNQTLGDVTCKVLKGIEGVFAQWMPDMILVQGDNTTVMAAALAAFYHKMARAVNPYGDGKAAKRSPRSFAQARCLRRRCTGLPKRQRPFANMLISVVRTQG